MARRVNGGLRIGSGATRGSTGPVNTVPPSISGTVGHGGVLTATPGTWTGSPSITGQWYAGASAISGETGTTYTVDRADGGFFSGLTYRETDSVSGTSADSNALEYDYLVGLGSCAIVHDMAEGVTVVSGGIDAQLDQTANGNAITAATATVRPVYTASDAGFNGQPTGTGDGVDDVLRIASATLGAATIGPGALIAVCKMVVNVNGRTAQCYGTGGTPWRHNESPASRLATTFGGTVVTDSTSFTTRARALISVADGAQLVRYVDGSAIGTPAAYVATLATGLAYTIFSFASPTSYSNMTFAFAAMTRTGLTAAQAADFGQYSRERWGTV